MNNSKQLLHVLAICFLCVSCAPIIPIPMHHYYPEAKGGKTLYDRCPLNDHVPYGIQFSQQNITVITRLGKHKGKRYIEIGFKVPERKIVKLVDTSTQLFWNGANQSIEIEFEKILLSPFFYVINSSNPVQVKVLAIHEPMVGIGKPGKKYWLGSYLELPDSDKIQIVLPQFTVNDQLITLPEIQFQKKWVIGFLLINC